MPPMRGASGWMMSTAVLDQAMCSATLDSISPVAIGGVQDLGQLRVAFGVVGVQRFFDPDQVELLQLAAHAQGGGAVPLLVGVHHERDVVAEVLADGGDAARSSLLVGQADLDLDAADASVQGLRWRVP